MAFTRELQELEAKVQSEINSDALPSTNAFRSYDAFPRTNAFRSSFSAARPSANSAATASSAARPSVHTAAASARRLDAEPSVRDRLVSMLNHIHRDMDASRIASLEAIQLQERAHHSFARAQSNARQVMYLLGIFNDEDVEMNQSSEEGHGRTNGHEDFARTERDLDRALHRLKVRSHNKK